MIRTFSCAVLLGLLLSVHASAQQIPEPPPVLVLSDWEWRPEQSAEVDPGNIDWHVRVKVTNTDDRGPMVATLTVRWQHLDAMANWVYYDLEMPYDTETIPFNVTKRLQVGGVKEQVQEGHYRFEATVTAKIIINGVATQSATHTEYGYFTVEDED